jgi:uncharacterized protein YeaO (DUF488 family)
MTRRSAKRRSADHLQLSAFRIGEGPGDGAALRIATVRLPPRGVKKEKHAELFDVWLPLLAPSRELLSWWRKGPPDAARFRDFATRYHREMAAPETRQAIDLVAAAARRTPIAIGCYCDRPQCHRFLLERLIRNAAAQRD